MTRGRSIFPPPSPKPLTLAALSKPPILRRNKDGKFMPTEEIERDDARLLAASRARPSSRPPVNKTEDVFPASGWPTGPQVQESDEESLTDSKILAAAPSTPPPIPARSPLRPRYVAPAAAIVQSPSNSSRGSSLFGPAGGSGGFHHGNPWSLSGRLPPVVALLSPSVAPSAPSEYLGSVSSEEEEVEYEGPRGVGYNPETTGLTSGFSSSSSSGGSVVVSLCTTMVARGRRWSV